MMSALSSSSDTTRATESGDCRSRVAHTGQIGFSDSKCFRFMAKMSPGYRSRQVASAGLAKRSRVHRDCW